MGGGEESTPVKPSEPNAPSYPDWSSSMQAYYGGGAAPPFFATTVTPASHPYLWGTQHAFVPPYGTPVPYPALYSPAGVFPHPNMTPVPNEGPANTDIEANAPNGKDQTLNKKLKGTRGKGRQGGNAGSGSGNDGATLSTESGSEGSSDASDDVDNQAYASKKEGFNHMTVDGINSQTNPMVGDLQSSALGNPSAPRTNLNIGMNLWNTNSTGDATTKMRPDPSGHSQAPMVGGEGIMTNRWIHDDRELKREKRKQSNRESARRSRLRKQAECEELQAKVEKLTDENQTLRDELQRLSELCQKLTSENNSFEEELTKAYGSEPVSDCENNNAHHLLQPHSPNGNS